MEYFVESIFVLVGVNKMDYGDMSKEDLIKELRRKDIIIKESLNKDTELMLRAILESTADGILVLDYNSNILHYNKKFLEIWKVPEEILSTRDACKLVHYVEDQLSNSENFISGTKKITADCAEHIDRLYFNNHRVVERHFSPLILDGNLEGIVWTFRDITHRVILERELIKSKKLYRRLIERLPEGVVVYRDSKVFLINNAAEELLKVNKMEVLGQDEDCLGKIHPDFEKISAERFKDLSSNETSLKFYEKKLILNSGEIILIETASFSFISENQLFITSIFRDITERKKILKLEQTITEKNKLLAAEKEYSKLKTQLFSTISHELKTPLNIIFASIQLLEKLYLIEPLNKYFKVMKQNCYRLLRLINNLIDINRIEVGFYKLDFKNHDVIRIIEDITLSVVDYTKTKDIELIFDTDVEEKIMACDAEKLERIMLNLLSNAIKFTEPSGTIKVNIYDRIDKIEIHVKDSGIGIPKDMLNTIFETFRQVDSSFRRKAEGSGIGLSLVKSLVELHDGMISVVSDLGIGSNFIIELPVKLAENETMVEKETQNSDYTIEKINIEFSDIYS